MPSGRNRRILGASAVIVLLLSACTSAALPDLPDPPRVPVAPTSTSLADFSAQQLGVVPGTTAAPGVGVKGGRAAFTGRVMASGVPVGGATVRLERFVGDRSASLDVTADAQGVWTVDGLTGGRYRVRAFHPPESTMTNADVVFLGSTERRSLDLVLDRSGGGLSISSAVAPDPPILGQQANIVVSVATKSVDAGGVIRSVPQANVPLVIISAGGRAVLTAPVATTNGSGRAQWTIACVALENQGLSVQLPDGSQYPVNVSGCRLPPSTTTSSPLPPA